MTPAVINAESISSVRSFERATKPDNHVWCLSAGPNHIVETPA